MTKNPNNFTDTEIYYQVSKYESRCCLIFLHGFGGSLSAYTRVRKYFNDKKISNISVDLRGHGFSQHSDNFEFYGMDNFALDIKKIMTRERFKNYVLVGHCFGGMVAINLMSKFPFIARALILINSSYKAPFFGKFFNINLISGIILNGVSKYLPDTRLSAHVDFDTYKGSGDYNIKRLLSDIAHTSLKSYTLMSQAACNFDSKKWLYKIKVPTLIIHGEKDRIFPKEDAYYLSNKIKNSTLVILPGVNHNPVINTPDLLSETIYDFLLEKELV